MEDLINKEVIVRSDKAGVFFGTLVKKEGTELTLLNARKLYYWSGASAVEQLATDGVKYPANCKFTITVSLIILSTYDQIIPVTEKATNVIKSVPEWKQ